MSDQQQFLLTTSDGQAISWRSTLPDGADNHFMEGSRLYYYDLAEKGNILFYRVAQQPYQAWLNRYSISEPTSIHLQSMGEGIMLYFVIQGFVDYRDKLQHNRAYEGNVYLIPAPMLNHDLIFPAGDCQVFHLFIPPTKLALYLQAFPAAGRLLGLVSDPLPPTVLDHDIRDEGRLLKILSSLLGRPRKVIKPEALRQMLDDVIVSGLDLFSNHVNSFAGLLPAEKAAVIEIRAYLLAHIQDLYLPALQQLSQKAGMNEKKLEEIFKLAYGCTMFDFFQTARFEAIYRRLAQPIYYLLEISEDFGYENYSSFSAAVKKRFDKSPRQIRKGVL
ncbi:AraC family transcriptional regulator [Chitinophaga sp. CC14]|uniref:helix-turn-helix domain-containing protein n=1 Tax=Chitinophaga sp. CC14 TaxID=3029199 RepID=UPI003B818E54